MDATELFALGHVKWFTQIMPESPEPLAQVLTAVWWGGFALTVTVMLALTYLNVPLQKLPWVERIHQRLDRVRPAALWIARIGLAVPLVFAGIGDYLFHYELGPVPGWVRVAQVALGVLMLAPGVFRLAAILVGLLGLYGVGHFGLHGMIDYISWIGACYFVATRGTKYEVAAIPTLYITTGISLSWAAIEKWVYPTMSLNILEHHGIPTFGFPPEAFLALAGWVELAVGYLLIAGVLNRFLALVVTGLFVMTSAVFGPLEILGHWQLHTALLIFLAEGTGRLVTPVLWHRPKWLQLAFVGVTLVPFVGVLMAAFYLLAP